MADLWLYNKKQTDEEHDEVGHAGDDSSYYQRVKANVI